MSDYPEAFCIACNELLKAEGGYVNDPRDPGGETRFGISKRSYPNVDIKALTLPDAVAIYFRDYWLPAGCEHYPASVAAAVFDAAVNQGVRTAVEMLQTALRVTSDGVVGTQTVSAARAAGATALGRFTKFRILRYVRTEHFDRFGEGWVGRAIDIALKAARL